MQIVPESNIRVVRRRTDFEFDLNRGTDRLSDFL
jgi:hypothetical protein